MTLNDLIKEAQAIVYLFSSDDVHLNQEIHLNLISDGDGNYTVDVCMKQEHSLPAGLDEAAEEQCKANNKELALGGDKRTHYLCDGEDSFKAGVEWMAGQGASFREEVCSLYHNGKPADYGFYDTSICKCEEYQSDREIISKLSLKDDDIAII